MDNLEPEIKDSLFNSTFYENPQPMWFFSVETLKVLAVNLAAITYYGYSKEELLSMTILDFRHEDDQADFDFTVKFFAGNDITKRTSIHTIKDGSTHYCQVITHPVIFNGQKARLTTMTDLTETSLYIDRFNLIAKATHDAIWDWNLETDEIWWNQSFLDLFGYKKEEVEKTVESWASRIHPDDRERVLDHIHRAINSGEINWSDEYRFLKADGTYAYILDRGYTIFKNGKAVRMVGSMMDTTEHRQLLQAREESESLLQTITSASPAALWMSDEVGNVIYVNQKWVEWSNAAVSDNLGYGWMEAVHADDKTRVSEVYRIAYVNKKAYEVDYRILFNDGSVRWVMAEGQPRFSADGRFVGFVGSVSDITRQKHLEVQKGGFISTVSHELKTPIASLKGYEQLLSRSKAVKDVQAINFLNRMRVQISRLDTLVQDLLDVSRIETGKLTFKESEFEVNVLMAELVMDLQQVFPTHILMLIENQSCKIYADRNRVVQLITNLVDNAVKYSPGETKVFIKLTCDEEFMTFSVQDFGKGILKEQEPYIFERFYQVNNVYKAPGLGIGLYVCKEIINRLHGNIWFDSRPGEGTTFYFKLPRKLD
jgi:PAS domain S-box-containing protein